MTEYKVGTVLLFRGPRPTYFDLAYSYDKNGFGLIYPAHLSGLDQLPITLCNTSTLVRLSKSS